MTFFLRNPWPCWPSEGIRPVNLDIVITLLIVASVLGALASNRVPADITMMAALVMVLVTGVVSPGEALSGFANPGLMTIAALYVVAAALRDTGALYWWRTVCWASRNLCLPASYGWWRRPLC